MATTIEDVARVASVSPATVSHVVNGTRRVSDEVCARVKATIDELGYHPNSLARTLRTGRSHAIGLIIPDISNLYFAEFARLIDDLGHQSGYSIILCSTNDDVDQESAYVDVLLSRQVDGIIFIAAGDSSANLQKCFDRGAPVVVVDRELAGHSVAAVCVDNHAGGYLATRHLIGLGHTKIGCISGPPSVQPSAQRVAGYRDAMSEAGLKVDDEWLAVGDFHTAGGETCANQILRRRSSRPSALFACNDFMAIGAMRSARRLGLRVPEDLSVIGFDDIPLAESLMPALTTIAQPIEEMTQIAVSTLIARMKATPAGELASAPDPRPLQPRLIVRDSAVRPAVEPVVVPRGGAAKAAARGQAKSTQPSETGEP